ncbi:MAG: VWA domain-containing protein [Alphaproteobacteria bacterium]|nr:VWA domain-containing protein [Alphaproteobacteria bacterium]
MTFGNPYFFLVFPLSLFIYTFFPKKKKEGKVAFYIPFLSDVKILSTKRQQAFWGEKIKFILLFLSVLFFVLAGMRPQYVGVKRPIQNKAREVMIALDISGSMAEQDFFFEGAQVSRFSLVKNKTLAFLNQRTGDKVGLILFGTQAFLAVPLTQDLKAIKQMLKEVSVGMAGGQTALFDAIGLTLKSMKDSKSSSKVLILLSDGVANAGHLQVQKALSLAKEERLKIYTIGLSPKERRFPSLFGGLTLPSGELDEALLQKIADETGGLYFKATDETSFSKIYKKIEELEPVLGKKAFYQPVKEVFYMPLLISLLCFLILFLLKGGDE